MTSRGRIAIVTLGAACLIGGCKETTRDLAGGTQIDALQKAKTASAQAGAQGQQRFKDGLKAGASDADIEAATGEPAP
jgi:hypothetical protein